MKNITKKVYLYSTLVGIDWLRLYKFFAGLPWFIQDLRKLKKQRVDKNNQFPITKLYPCVIEKDAQSGSTRGHYFTQDLFVAQRIYIANPSNHIDIGSRVDGFVAHVAVFREIFVGDIRAMPSTISNINFVQINLMEELPLTMIDAWHSISCLHALEHFGLGRYGDPVDMDGHIRGLANLSKMLKPSGVLYLSVPIGKQRIEFNAHRVFSLQYLMELFQLHNLDIASFSYIDDLGHFHQSANPSEVNQDLMFGCGIFELNKAVI